MIQKQVAIILVMILVFIASCRVSKVPVTTGKLNASEESYIATYKDLAISEMKRTGVPASITLAQGIIESDFGRSRLAREANNHFGIKCHDDWTGPTIKQNDDKRNECFRKYSHPDGSYKDHSDFLRSETRYRSLFSLDIKDYKGWAAGLKKAGYATNPDYANMLIRKIEQYSLDQYDGISATSATTRNKKNDADVIQAPVRIDQEENKPADSNLNNSVTAKQSRIKEKNRIQYIIVEEGDSKTILEKEFQLLGWELARYNELQSGFKINPGQILYLQPKREKAEAGNDFHFAVEGETMYIISQLYGIKLKSLLNMNRMLAGENPKAGQKIWLRSMKPLV
jgi:LysM repeat protein